MAEDPAGDGIGEGQEVVGTREADEAGDDVRLQPVCCQPLRLQRDHRGIVGAGGVAHDDDPARVAADLASMACGPGDGCGRILDEARPAPIRMEAVVGDDRDEPACHG